MRHAIGMTWARGNVTYRNQLFGGSASVNKKRPTNSEFIALIADKLRLEQEAL
jgi:two-component system response regulator (stage 0 sporulation protein A)